MHCSLCPDDASASDTLRVSKSLSSGVLPWRRRRPALHCGAFPPCHIGAPPHCGLDVPIKPRPRERCRGGVLPEQSGIPPEFFLQGGPKTERQILLSFKPGSMSSHRDLILVVSMFTKILYAKLLTCAGILPNPIVLPSSYKSVELNRTNWKCQRLESSSKD